MPFTAHDVGVTWDRIARRQSGVITRAQFVAAGVTVRQVDAMVVAGRAVPTGYRGVYRAAGAPDTRECRAWAAVLGARSVLSYLSAAQWWELPVESDGRIHITRHERQKWVSTPLVRVHRTVLDPRAVTTWLGLPVTTRTETLLDCMGWLPGGTARGLLDRAFQQHWLSGDQIQRRLDDQPGRWGNRQLAQLLRASRPGAEAESERRLQKLLDRAGITGWTGNYWLTLEAGSFRIDVAFPDFKIAIEVDGWAFHRTKERRDRDMAKANALSSARWRLLTFSWEDVTKRPDYVLGAITSLLVTQRAI
jgi:very-short-patch-repair endonuclease